VGFDANGAHAWATASVRDAEGLVQVQVAHVSTNVTGAGQTDLQETDTAAAQQSFVSRGMLKQQHY
jgi:hypothetical protein